MNQTQRVPHQDHCALVLFSGGQDSATTLAWALENFSHVETLGFDYGQNHLVELQCRKRIRRAFKEEFPLWQDRLGEDHILALPTFHQLADSSLTRSSFTTSPQENGLPSSFVPGRNLVFLIYAATVAYKCQIRHIVTGVCETDYSGYPDCRDDSIKAMQVALNLGMDENFVIHTPLMWLTKAQTWEMAYKLAGNKLVKLINIQSHSCYRGERGQKHDWGYGCGECPACRLRRDGWLAWEREYAHD